MVAATLSRLQSLTPLLYRDDCILKPPFCRVPYNELPRHTEVKIDELCARAKTAKTEREVKRVGSQLRAALSEHIGLARQSLGAQMSALSTLHAKTKDIETKAAKSQKTRVGGPQDPGCVAPESVSAA